MSNEEKAKQLVKKQYPDAEIKDCFKFKDLYLVRVEHPDPEEANYDPFFSVDNNGAVKEFSIGVDGDPIEIAKAFNQRN